MKKFLRELIQERNQIVHWQTATHTSDGRVTLIPPNIWEQDANTPHKAEADIQAFEAKTVFATGFLNMFLLLINGALKKLEAEEPWDKLCLKAVTYPPPKGHPLHVKET